jgi:hypothetical protein
LLEMLQVFNCKMFKIFRPYGAGPQGNAVQHCSIDSHSCYNADQCVGIIIKNWENEAQEEEHDFDNK